MNFLSIYFLSFKGYFNHQVIIKQVLEDYKSVWHKHLNWVLKKSSYGCGLENAEK